MGFQTVRTGEQALIFDKSGNHKVIDGPWSGFLWRKSFQLLQKYFASQRQYIVVSHVDGLVEHVPGPCALFFNPVEHSNMSVVSSLVLNTHEVLVVYKRERSIANGHKPYDETGLENNQEQNLSRRIVRGPAMFIPHPDEHLHEFVWHGTDPNDKTKKVPRALRFKQLRVCPDQFYYNIGAVRTKDDALITVKLMLFFELIDIETMLNLTHDPIGDFINAVCADTVQFAAVRTYEEFLEQTSVLNDLETYPQLTRNAERIGYRVTKVVYRGYNANLSLEKMHEDSIQARTKLRLQSETEQQTQAIADMQLAAEEQRAQTRQQMEKEEANHRNIIDEIERGSEIKQIEDKRRAELNALKAENEERLNFLNTLKKDMGVDITKYLVAQFETPDKVIRIAADGENGKNTKGVHIHSHN